MFTWSKMFPRTVSTNSNLDEELQHVSKLEQRFVIEESLGRGGFGQIIKAKRKSDDNKFALKIIKFDSNMEDIGTIRKEANTLSQLNHNNIVRYYDSWVEEARLPIEEYKKMFSDSEEFLSDQIYILSQNGFITENLRLDDDDDYEEDDFDDEGNMRSNSDSVVPYSGEQFKDIQFLLIQMELCDKRTLRTAIDNNLCQEEPKLTKYFREICEGLAYIHKNYIVHRDLKPENIFLTSNDVIKIGDFGLSKKISLDNSEATQTGGIPCGSLSEVCGTSIYIAPELYSRKSFNTKADIYSLGVTYFEMCSKPMTGMEKSRTFPITAQYLKKINFFKNSFKKKLLIKNLLHVNDAERPNCDEILKILNSEKSNDELKEMIQQNRKIPVQQYKEFGKTLKATSTYEQDLLIFFIKKAVKIFELHGAENISIPIFLPYFKYCSNHLINLLNTRGNSISLSNTSAVSFSHYVAKNAIKDFRRYSIGKAFEQGYFSPSEVQECAFQAVTPEIDDHVVEAEVMYIGKEITDKILEGLSREISEGLCESRAIYFIINHRIIFSTIIKHCKMSKEQAEVFINVLRNSSYTGSGMEIGYDFNFEINHEVKLFLAMCLNKYFNIKVAEEYLSRSIQSNIGKDAFAKIKTSSLVKAFNEIKIVVANAKKFGIESDNFLFTSLLINQPYSTGVMFKMLHLSSRSIIASGGRFDALIKRCNRIKKKQSNHSNFSAIELSFNVEKVLNLLTRYNKNPRPVDVIILAEEKTAAISLYKELLFQGIKCKIVKKLLLPDKSDNHLIVIQLISDNLQVMSYSEQKNNQWTSTEILRGDLRKTDFLEVLYNKLPRQMFQTIYPKPTYFV